MDAKEAAREIRNAGGRLRFNDAHKLRIDGHVGARIFRAFKDNEAELTRMYAWSDEAATDLAKSATAFVKDCALESCVKGDVILDHEHLKRLEDRIGMAYRQEDMWEYREAVRLWVNGVLKAIKEAVQYNKAERALSAAGKL